MTFRSIESVTEQLKEDCKYCLDPLQGSSSGRKVTLLPCFHLFHTNCVQTVVDRALSVREKAEGDIRCMYCIAPFWAKHSARLFSDFVDHHFEIFYHVMRFLFGICVIRTVRSVINEDIFGGASYATLSIGFLMLLSRDESLIKGATAFYCRPYFNYRNQLNVSLKEYRLFRRKSLEEKVDEMLKKSSIVLKKNDFSLVISKIDMQFPVIRAKVKAEKETVDADILMALIAIGVMKGFDEECLAAFSSRYFFRLNIDQYDQKDLAASLLQKMSYYFVTCNSDRDRAVILNAIFVPDLYTSTDLFRIFAHYYAKFFNVDLNYSRSAIGLDFVFR